MAEIVYPRLLAVPSRATNKLARALSMECDLRFASELDGSSGTTKSASY